MNALPKRLSALETEYFYLHGSLHAGQMGTDLKVQSFSGLNIGHYRSVQEVKQSNIVGSLRQ
jgi:hypothetical protein